MWTCSIPFLKHLFLALFPLLHPGKVKKNVKKYIKMNMQYSLMLTFLCQHACTQGRNTFFLHCNVAKLTRPLRLKIITNYINTSNNLQRSTNGNTYFSNVHDLDGCQLPSPLVTTLFISKYP